MTSRMLSAGWVTGGQRLSRSEEPAEVVPQIDARPDPPAEHLQITDRPGGVELAHPPLAPLASDARRGERPRREVGVVAHVGEEAAAADAREVAAGAELEVDRVARARRAQ